MSAQLLTSGVIFGLSIGSIFFLMAIGLSLCFGLMRIISLDQMLYYSIGGYLTYSLSLASGSVWLAVCILSIELTRHYRQRRPAL